jgi:hypothetical protein
MISRDTIQSFNYWRCGYFLILARLSKLKTISFFSTKQHLQQVHWIKKFKRDVDDLNTVAITIVIHQVGFRGNITHLLCQQFQCSIQVHF